MEMGREKRKSTRIKRRFVVRFGERELDHAGFTIDVSSTGAFVAAAQVPPLDARLHLQLFVNDSRYLLFEGRVQRHKLVPPELRQIAKAGFGVKFLHPSDLLKEVVPVTQVVELPRRFRLELKSQEMLKRVFDSEVRHGGAFVRTPTVLARDTVAEIEFVLRYLERPPSLVFLAKVLHVMEDTAHATGMGFEFLERDLVNAELSPFLL